MIKINLAVLCMSCTMSAYAQLNFQSIHYNLPSTVDLYSSTVSPNNELIVSGVQSPYSPTDNFIKKFDPFTQVWIDIPLSVAAPNYIYSIASNSDGLYVHVNGTIVRTQDDGLTWDSMMLNMPNFHVHSMSMNNQGEVQIVGYDKSVSPAVNEHYALVGPTGTWNYVQSGQNGEIFEFHYVDSHVFRFSVEASGVHHLQISSNETGPWISVDAGLGTTNFFLYELFSSPQGEIFACIRDDSTPSSSASYLQLDTVTYSWNTVGNPFTGLPSINAVFEVEELNGEYAVVVDTVMGVFKYSVFATALNLSNAEYTPSELQYSFDSSTDVLTIYELGNHLSSIQIMDMTGRVVYNRDMSGSSIQIDLSSFPSGNYLIRSVCSNHEVKQVKFAL